MSAAAASYYAIRPVLPFPRDNAADQAAPPRQPAAAPAHLLLMDNEPAGLAAALRAAFPAPAYRVQVVGADPVSLCDLRADAPDVVILGVGASPGSGLEVYRQLRQSNARVPVVCVGGARRADAAIEVMKHGACNFLFEPVEPPVLRQVVGEALEVARRMRDPALLGDTDADLEADGALLGACPAMGEVYKAIGRVAAQDVPVLITGESGTGKELVARALYQHSRRADQPFLALNCAAIPESLLESELFGHEKGAFTGADRRRIGKFEQVSGGTIFLDEIGDMPLALQAKMLRLLQDQSFERVGGNETVRTDVRLIAATHRDLAALAAEGKFRPDLFYRLGVFTIGLPPLRERQDDLPLLVRHFLKRFSQELGREVRAVAPEALERLRGHGWPGNIRELQSVLKQALLQASGPVLLPAFLPELPAGTRQAVPGERPAAGAAAGATIDLKAFVQQRLGPDINELYAETHRQVDRLLLPRVLEHTGGNQHQAARLLGIARQTLRTKLRELGLHIAHAVAAAADAC
jgi:two-component system nitrogen regulation response regulator GlnG